MPTRHARKAEADAQKLRADAEATKRQADAELARARSDAESSRAARAKADADAAAARLRAQAEADAARIRADAEAAAARTKSDAEAAAKAAEAQAAKTRDATGASRPRPPLRDKGARAARQAGTGRFDGTWNVSVDCPKGADGTLGYSNEFVVQVKDGYLRGERLTEGTPSWLLLQGNIQPDGIANLVAKGLTADPKFTLKGLPKGTPYGFDVAARFDGSRGTGRRMQLRPCDVTFIKQ